MGSAADSSASERRVDSKNFQDYLDEPSPFGPRIASGAFFALRQRLAPCHRRIKLVVKLQFIRII